MEKKAYDERKKNSMSVQKIKALNDLGFVWAKRKGQAAWNEKFDELVAYKDEHGDCQVPTKFPENPALGRWVSTQVRKHSCCLDRLHHASLTVALVDTAI